VKSTRKAALGRERHGFHDIPEGRAALETRVGVVVGGEDLVKGKAVFKESEA
jgi:hypothetical protein